MAHNLLGVWSDLGGDRSAFKHAPTVATMIPYFRRAANW